MITIILHSCLVNLVSRQLQTEVSAAATLIRNVTIYVHSTASTAHCCKLSSALYY